MTLSVGTVLMAVLLFWWPAHNLALALFAWRAPRTRPRADTGVDPDPLLFWIIIPALNEERVIGNTVRNALSLGTATTPVHVLVVDDGSDDATPTVLAGIRDERLHVLRRDPPEARKGKGEALNAAYRYIQGKANADGTTSRTVVGVIDGDGRGSNGLLTEVAAMMSERSVGAVQCRVRIHNRHNALALLQDLEFGAVSDASQSLRDMAGSVGMGGNGQFTRLSVLQRFHPSPWTDCLVEDLELGLRLHLAGIRVRYTQRAWVTQQGLEDLNRLLRQRTRWAQGNLQCVQHVRSLLGSRFVASVGLADFLIYLLTPWVTVPLSLFAATMLVTLPIAILNGATLGGLVSSPDLLPQAAALWAVALFLPGIIWSIVYRLRLRAEPLHRCLLAGLLYPGFLMLGVIATWRALFRLITKRNKWAKTERLADSAPVTFPDETPTSTVERQTVH